MPVSPPPRRFIVLGSLCALLVVLVALFLSCTTELSTAPVLSKPGTTTTIILVRHGEREEGFNPPLNADGLARAQALVAALGENGVTAIYAPELIRTTQTAQPLADHLGLQINPISLVRLVNPSSLAQDLVEEILQLHAGGVVLYVGNDSNLEALYRRLGGTGEPPIRHQDLYTVVIGETGAVHFIKATYGKTI